MIKIELIKKPRLQEEDIEAYFKDCGNEYFDCGEGYYQDESTIYVQLDSGKIYEVHMEAICEGNKTDWGDRIYFVDEITKVEFKEVEEIWLINRQLEELEYEREQTYVNIRQIYNKICDLVDRKYKLEEGK